MSKFIRLDAKGTFRGTEHKSSRNGLGEEFETWENGISCYELTNAINAVESLYAYWTEVACCRVSEFEGMQVTVFEGTHNECFGQDGEDLAACKSVINISDAYEFMNAIYEMKEAVDNYENDWDEDELKLSKEEYEEKLLELLTSVKAY